MKSRLKLSLAAATILTATLSSPDAYARESFYNLRNNPPQIVVNLSVLEDLKPRPPIENQLHHEAKNKRPNRVAKQRSSRPAAVQPKITAQQKVKPEDMAVVAPYDSKFHERGEVSPKQSPDAIRQNYARPKLTTTQQVEDYGSYLPPAPVPPAPAVPADPAKAGEIPPAPLMPFGAPRPPAPMVNIPIDDSSTVKSIGGDPDLIARKIAEAKARAATSQEVRLAPDAVIAPPPAPELPKVDAKIEAPKLEPIKPPVVDVPPAPPLPSIADKPELTPPPASKANLAAPAPAAPLTPPPALIIPPAPPKSSSAPKVELKAPEVALPEPKAPEIKLPEAPKMPELPKVEAPKLEAPKLEAPKLEAPKLTEAKPPVAPKLPEAPIRPVNDSKEVVALPAPKLDLPPPPSALPTSKTAETSLPLPPKPVIPEQPNTLTSEDEKAFEDLKRKMEADEAKNKASIEKPAAPTADKPQAAPAPQVNAKNLPPLVITQPNEPDATIAKAPPAAKVSELPPIDSLFNKDAPKAPAAPSTPTLVASANDKDAKPVEKEVAMLTPPPAVPAIPAPPAPPVPGKPSLETVVQQPAETSAPAPAQNNADISIIYGEAEISLPPTEKPSLDRVVSQLNNDKKISISVISYASGTPDQASRAKQTALHRALEVRKYLMDRNISSDRIEIKPLGNKSGAGVPDRVDVFVNKGNS